MSRRAFFLGPLTAALLLLAVSLPVGAAPEATGSGPVGITDSVLMSVITTVGDDTFSTTDLGSLLDPVSGTPTQHYGPYASGSPDSGRCGNNWADDTFNRVFTVHTSSTGEITVVEQFKDGSFVTMDALSPGACETYTNHGTFVRGQITGSMHGYFIIPLPPLTTQTSTDASCVANMPAAPCTTAGFIDSHFTPCYGAGACSASTFFDHYTAPNNQDLIYNEWKNASDDRGGDSGDIATS